MSNPVLKAWGRIHSSDLEEREEQTGRHSVRAVLRWECLLGTHLPKEGSPSRMTKGWILELGGHELAPVEIKWRSFLEKE